MGIVVHCTELAVVGSCDAAYAVHQDGMSHTGFFVGLGTPKSMSFVHCKSAKQKTTATASTDAEVIAVADGVKFMIYLRNLISELQLVPLQPIVVQQDNMSSIKMHTEQTKAKRSKHILTKVQYVKCLVKSAAVVLEWTPTDEMISDVLTKPLGFKKFIRFAAVLLGTQWLHVFR
jgi:hypothetical protein